MSLDTLKRMRTIVPGAIFLVFLLPLFLPLVLAYTKADTLFSWAGLVGGVVYLVVATVLGTVYYSLRVRDLLWRGWEQQVQDNIKDRMLSAFQQDQPISEATFRLRQRKGLIHILYGFLDRDNSLQQKVKNVYFNGLVASSLVDAQILSTLFIGVYLLAYLLWGVPLYPIAATAAWAILLLVRGLLVPVTKKHMELGDDQIDYILVHYKDELRDRLRDLASAS